MSGRVPARSASHGRAAAAACRLRGCNGVPQLRCRAAPTPGHAARTHLGCARRKRNARRSAAVAARCRAAVAAAAAIRERVRADCSPGWQARGAEQSLGS